MIIYGKGTVATTFFHDHHNLFVAGNDPKDMLFAVQRIGELQGGFLKISAANVEACSLPKLFDEENI